MKIVKIVAIMRMAGPPGVAAGITGHCTPEHVIHAHLYASIFFRLWYVPLLHTLPYVGVTGVASSEWALYQNSFGAPFHI
ncbi:hypothetical protein TNCV_4818791 [Trichonephila clavipes]|nr:hypothetical protein TNCV_4818791 [Trichonephila clavipes]